MVAGGFALVTAVALVSCALVPGNDPPSGHKSAPPQAKPSTPACTVSALLVPSCGVWFGAAVTTGATTSPGAAPGFVVVLGSADVDGPLA